MGNAKRPISASEEKSRIVDPDAVSAAALVLGCSLGRAATAFCLPSTTRQSDIARSQAR